MNGDDERVSGSKPEVLKQVAPWIAFVASVLTVATLYVTLGGPVPAMDHELEALEERTDAKINDLNDFSVDTRVIILQNDLTVVQREIEDISNALAEGKGNPDLRRLRDTLRDKERSLQGQIQQLQRAATK